MFDTEALLKLLKESDEIEENKPFGIFLQQYNIKEGENLVKVKTIISLYKASRKRNSITERDALKFFKIIYIKDIAYCYINYTERQIKLKLNRLKPKKDIEINALLKRKFENFIKENELYSYRRYQEWFKETKRDNSLTEKEFKILKKIYFK